MTTFQISYRAGSCIHHFQYQHQFICRQGLEVKGCATPTHRVMHADYGTTALKCLAASGGCFFRPAMRVSPKSPARLHYSGTGTSI
jgi:hypothetical protein